MIVGRGSSRYVTDLERRVQELQARSDYADRLEILAHQREEELQRRGRKIERLEHALDVAEAQFVALKPAVEWDLLSLSDSCPDPQVVEEVKELPAAALRAARWIEYSGRLEVEVGHWRGEAYRVGAEAVAAGAEVSVVEYGQPVRRPA